ncbi:O-antigen ligase family protein [Petroclostridium sp. X23]|uniref:O-antigen ligase family protein n=1 Tax=Petroclostridium sp. X23 TaxID=3045146 RepID=UPI0024AD4C68|nr:O-antigen ligase family protein [Petroclostridium sp. X23]WHH57408.1 O-antigen ligase family protein [Petroclostridium sp. X23]
MGKRRKNAVQVQSGNHEMMKWILLSITSALIALPPFFRGLFFEEEQFVVYIISFISFIALLTYKAIKKERLALNTYLDYTLIGLVIAYTISAAGAVNTRLAIAEVLKYFNYLVIYFLVKELIHESKYVKLILSIILGSITTVAFIGLGAAAGTFKYDGAYSLAENEKWINSTIQYHNAFAALVLCGLLLCYVLYTVYKNMWVKSIISISGFMLLFGFIFSYSRGAWVLLPIFIFILMIAAWKYILMDMIALSISLIVPTVISAQGFRAATLLRDQSSSWKWLVIGFAVCIIVNLLMQYIINVCKKRMGKLIGNYKIIIISLIGVLTLGGIIAFLFAPNILAKILPQDLLSRLQGINFSTGTVRERFVFYFDAFEIVKDYPVLGGGGGAWESLYFMYQSYLYWSNQAHSYIMQVWVETGTIGFIIYIGTILAFLIESVRCLRKHMKEQEDYLLLIGIFTAAGSLVAHSFIDFDLSLSAISIILWTLFALIGVYASQKDESHKLNKELPIRYGIIPTIVLFITVCTFAVASDYARKGVRYGEAKRLTEAAVLFRSAVNFDPLMASYRIDYANTLFDSYVKDNKIPREVMDEAKKQAEKSLSLDKYNADRHARAGAFYFKIGEIDRALELFDKSVQLQPLRPENYQQKAHAYLQAAQYYLNKKDNDKAKELVQEVISIEEQIEQLNAIKLKPVTLNSETGKMIEQAKELLEKL